LLEFVRQRNAFSGLRKSPRILRDPKEGPKEVDPVQKKKTWIIGEPRSGGGLKEKKRQKGKRGNDKKGTKERRLNSLPVKRPNGAVKHTEGEHEP